MKRLSIWILIITLVIVGIYFIITRNGLPIININNVESISISSPEGIKLYNIEDNGKEIKNFIYMYNRAKRNYGDGDTTPEITIAFQLKNGKKITIEGNSQTYQYVHINGKSYKISGKELTSYMRSFYTRFQKQ